MIRLVVADDHPIVRAGLAALFGLEADIEVVAEASTPDEAVAATVHENPDVVLMDLQFGARSQATGADATRRIRALDAAPYVLVLTNYDSDADILGAVEKRVRREEIPRDRDSLVRYTIDVFLNAIGSELKANEVQVAFVDLATLGGRFVELSEAEIEGHLSLLSAVGE